MKHVMRSYDGTYYYVWSSTTEPKTGVLLPPWQDAGLIQMQKHTNKKDADKSVKTILDADNPAAALGRKGGMSKSKSKTAAARVNGALGGRPPKKRA
jgi:hypothetical protein